MTSRWFCSASCSLHAPTDDAPPTPPPPLSTPARSRPLSARQASTVPGRPQHPLHGVPLVVARLLDAFYHVTQHPCARVGSRRPSIQGQPVRNGQLLATVQGSGGPELGTSVNPLLHPNPGPAAGAPLFPLRHLPALVVLPMMTIILRNDDTAVEPVVPRC